MKQRLDRAEGRIEVVLSRSSACLAAASQDCVYNMVREELRDNLGEAEWEDFDAEAV
jgi:hypothetical protein